MHNIFHPSKIIFLFVLVFACLVGSLFWLHSEKIPFYFSNRVVADKSPANKQVLVIQESALTLSQEIDMLRVNVSNDRFLSDPICLGLRLNTAHTSPNPPARLTVSVMNGSTMLATWPVGSDTLINGYLQLCSSGQMTLNDLVTAQEPRIVIHAPASDQVNRARIHLSELLHGNPVMVNNSAIPDRTLPFKIDVVGSPTILDTLKYVFLAVVAGLIILIALLATRKDLQHLKTQRITKTKS
jgi:hypothetical protein